MPGKNKTSSPLTRRKKHVLLVVRWPVGGIRTYIRYVYRHFEPIEWRFTIIAPSLEEMPVLMEDLAGIDAVWIPVEGMPLDGSSGFLKMTRSITIQLFKSNYDLVHSHGFISGMCAAAPVFVRSIPHLMTSHDIINEGQFSGVKGFFKKKAMTLAFGLIGKVQSVSHDAQDNLLLFFPRLAKNTEKCIVISNGIETRRFFDAQPRALREELGIDKRFFLIGFFGRYMRQKGFRYLVEAIRILKKEGDAEKVLVLAFGGGGYFCRDLEFIKGHGLHEHFRILPFTENIAGAIKGVDVVAMPSLWEACGLLAMETLVCGTPLVASNCIGLREVLRNTPVKMVQKADARSLANTLRTEIHGRREGEFREYASAAVHRYDVVSTAGALKKLYKELIGIS